MDVIYLLFLGVASSSDFGHLCSFSVTRIGKEKKRNKGTKDHLLVADERAPGLTHESRMIM